MPITIPAELPAYDILTREGVMVMDEDQARRQDIRPLQIGLLNLMPKKAETETQFARVIGATPLQLDLTLIRMSDHESRNTPSNHLEMFYERFQDIKERKFDGLIITGAPIEHLDFDKVTYYQELREIFAWTQTHVHHTMAVCWGGMAMLNHFHGVRKDMLPAKAFGCFRHRNLAPASPYLRGFSDDFVVPVSRWTEMRQSDIDDNQALHVLMHSEEVGPCLIDDPDHRVLYMFNHLEYDSTTLKLEYDRDVTSGGEISIPVNYYPGDDPAQAPENRWRSHGHLLYGNWINEIYQTTHFDMSKIGA
ncbi:MAG: homoserine O-succinyltransferase [Pseudomonadota bacterium]